MKGLFVIGTDTGVGKTLVSTTLLRAWATAGRRVAAMKPCETGEGDDGEQLLAATLRPLDPALVRPYRFALPAAPLLAAAREGQHIDLDVLHRALAQLASDAERVLVEAAGGLLVPWTSDTTTADLIARTRLPVLLVARTGLGTINHTLLTLEALRHRDVRVLGLVFSQSAATAGPEEAESVRYLEGAAQAPLLGHIPWLTAGSPTGRQREAAAHLRLEDIWQKSGL
ncbi:MAG: dethiobiotin synthase [Polyangia bacterium]